MEQIIAEAPTNEEIRPAKHCLLRRRVAVAPRHHHRVGHLSNLKSAEFLCRWSAVAAT